MASKAVGTVQPPVRPFASASLARLRGSLGSENGKPILMRGIRPTEQDREMISKWIKALMGRLQCAPDDAKAKAVHLDALLTAFPSQAGDQTSVDGRMAAYLSALKDIPSWAVAEACRRVLAGGTQFGRPWAPGPVELADLARVVLKPHQEDLASLREIGAAIERREPGAEERARVAQGFDDLRAELGRRTPEKWHDNPEDALRKRANALGIDYETAMDSIADRK